MKTCAVCNTKFARQTHDSPAEDCDCGGNWLASQCETEDDRIALFEAMQEWKTRQALAQQLTEKLTKASMVIISSVMLLPKPDRAAAFEDAIRIIRNGMAMAEKLELAVSEPTRPQ